MKQRAESDGNMPKKRQMIEPEYTSTKNKTKQKNRSKAFTGFFCNGIIIKKFTGKKKLPLKLRKIV